MITSKDQLAMDLRYVSKTYRRRVHALQGMEMKVHPGEVFGLLGPNGAGKSTLVKIVMTVIRPSRAEGTVLGHPLGHKPALARVGYLPENHRFPPYLTGRQALEYYAALAKVDRRTRRRRAAELMEMVGMKDWADAKVNTYSKGMQQRIGLAQALMNDPQLVVLDEPTDGLDPLGRREVREVLQRLRDQGKTVFLNSHLLSEVEQVCDRVAILVAGKVVRQGTLEDLTARSERYQIELHDDGSGKLRDAVIAAIPCPLEEVIDMTAPNQGQPTRLDKGALPDGEVVEVIGNRVEISTGDATRIQPILDALRGRGLVIQSVRLERQSLEDFFIQTVSGPQNGLQVAQPDDGGGPA